jgi:hypothetical protein
MRHVGSRRPGDEILPLGQYQIGAVDLEQRFAAPDGLAGRVDEQLLDPPSNFGLTTPMRRSSAATVPTARTVCAMGRRVAASVRTPSIWIRSGLIVTVPPPSSA